MTYEEEQTLDGATPGTDDPNFDELCEALAKAKAREAAATQARVAAEQALLPLLPTKDEGSVSRAGAAYKVIVTYPVNRTVDQAALESIRAAMKPELFESAISYKAALILPGLRSLQANEPAAYSLLAQAITAKPGKPSVKLEATATTDANKEP